MDPLQHESPHEEPLDIGQREALRVFATELVEARHHVGMFATHGGEWAALQAYRALRRAESALRRIESPHRRASFERVREDVMCALDRAVEARLSNPAGLDKDAERRERDVRIVDAMLNEYIRHDSFKRHGKDATKLGSMVADKVRQRVARQLDVSPSTVYRVWELEFLPRAAGAKAMVQTMRQETFKPKRKASSRGKGGGFKRLDFSKRLNTEKK